MKLYRISYNTWKLFFEDHNAIEIESTRYQHIERALLGKESLSFEGFIAQLQAHKDPKLSLSLKSKTFTIEQLLPANSWLSSFLKKVHFFKIHGLPDKRIKITLHTKDEEESTPTLAQQPCPLSLRSSLARESFDDPFTRLASAAFQKFETHFGFRKKIMGDLRLTLVTHEEGDTTLELKTCPLQKGPKLKPLYQEENRRTLQAFRSFVIQEHGFETLQKAQAHYGFDLDKMMLKGEPLKAEHVHRMNIAATLCEQKDIQTLSVRLKDKEPLIKELSPSQDLKEALISNPELLGGLSRRVQREIITLFATPCKLLAFIERLPHDACNLTTSDLATLVEILLPSDRLQGAYTGKEIIHTPIMGFYSTAAKGSFKPWLDRQETLHVFQDIHSSTSWGNFCEIATHVLAKKHLMHQSIDGRWEVGALIPGPQSSEGHKQWYRVSSYNDNNYGKVSYTLEPLAADSALPAVKLYRSTASDAYQMNGWSSAEADLYPFGSPGSQRFKATSKEEEAFFNQHTIPLWVGYSLQAKEKLTLLSQSPSSSLEAWGDLMKLYDKAFQELSLYSQERHPSDKANWQVTLKNSGLQTFGEPIEKGPSAHIKVKQAALMCQHILKQYGDQYQELPEYKKQQDLSLMGHSLGGSLAQQGAAYFLQEQRRMPLPGHHLHTYCSDAPAGVSKQQNRAWEAFGVQHSDLFKALKTEWSLDYRLEYGDFVPVAGDHHLGVQGRGNEEAEPWHRLSIKLFRPLSSTTAKEVRLVGTAHARRFKRAKKDIDYKVHRLSSRCFARLHGAWHLTRSERKLIGYKLIPSPRSAEIARRIVGAVAWGATVPLRRIKQFFLPPRGAEQRNSAGILHLT